MQQFVVPQFIDVEDKIFGPITTRQFLILLAAGLLIFIAYRLADFVLFLILLVLLGGSAIIFAFYRPNGQAFHYFALNIFQYFKMPNLRVWHKTYTKQELEYLRKRWDKNVEEVEIVKRPASREHIRDLSIVVNTGGYYKGDS